MRRLIGWLTAAIIITLIFGSTYAALQQPGRRSANVAPAAAAAAAQVQLIGSETLTVPRLELTPDSGVFVVGADDKPVSGTATLHGSLPVLPSGVLQTARDTGADAVTWQPDGWAASLSWPQDTPPPGFSGAGCSLQNGHLRMS